MHDAAYAARFWARVIKTDGGCWEWDGCHLPTGYGRYGKGYTHRLAYELLRGAIPEGLELDHLCRNRGCCNPEHLEAVTHVENARRGLRGELTTHCPYGHLYDAANTRYELNRLGNLSRKCRTCENARRRERYRTRGY